MQSKPLEAHPSNAANNALIQQGSRVREKNQEQMPGGERGTVVRLGTQANGGQALPGSNSTAVLASGLTSRIWKHWTYPAYQWNMLFQEQRHRSNGKRLEERHGRATT